MWIDAESALAALLHGVVLASNLAAAQGTQHGPRGRFLWAGGTQTALEALLLVVLLAVHLAAAGLTGFWNAAFFTLANPSVRPCKRPAQTGAGTAGAAAGTIGGAYQPALPSTFYGFSYLYDRTAAIGLLDHNMQQFGEQKMSIADIERAGMKLCATEQPAVASRFASHQDASKSSNFCGDVAYVTTLLSSFGFSDSYQMTMTNKIKDVELVWTLGAMLAKSAELANAGGAGGVAGSSFGGGLLVLAALAGVIYCSRRSTRFGGYRHVSAPLQTGHDSD